MTEGELEAGARCGPYEITRLIAAGGQGEVYEAVHDFTDQRVALKCLHLRHAGKKDLKERMRMEAVLLCKLRHPSIVTVYNAGITDSGIVFIAMDLLRGRTLREVLLATPRVPLTQAVSYAVRVADGVQAAHDIGIVHRDLKPENVFVTDEGEIKVLDLGTAKFYGYGPRITDEMRTPGTPAYMSPEHLSGEEVDGRTDVYALGLILYEMLAGRHAFARRDGLPTDRELVALQFAAEPKPLTDSTPSVPEGVAALVKKAMAKNRDERHRSMDLFARALEQAAGLPPTAARRSVPPEVGRPDVRDGRSSEQSPRSLPAAGAGASGSATAASQASGQPVDAFLRTEPSPPPIEGLGTGNVTLAFERDVHPGAPTADRPMPTTILTAPHAIEADLRSQPTRTDPRGPRYTPDPTTAPLVSAVAPANVGSAAARVDIASARSAKEDPLPQRVEGEREAAQADLGRTGRRRSGRTVVVVSAILGMTTAVIAVVVVHQRGEAPTSARFDIGDAAISALVPPAGSALGPPNDRAGLAVAPSNAPSAPAPTAPAPTAPVATVPIATAPVVAVPTPSSSVAPSPRRAQPARSRPSDAFVVPSFAEPAARSPGGVGVPPPAGRKAPTP